MHGNMARRGPVISSEPVAVRTSAVHTVHKDKPGFFIIILINLLSSCVSSLMSHVVSLKSHDHVMSQQSTIMSPVLSNTNPTY